MVTDQTLIRGVPSLVSTPKTNIAASFCEARPTFPFYPESSKLRYLPNTDSILVSDHFTLWSFHNRVTTSLCWLSFFPQQEDNHYAACARSSDIPNRPPVIISFLPSAAQVARLIFSIFFLLNHLNPPVGRLWDIAKPIKVISVQVHNIHWWFGGIISSHLFIIGFPMSAGNIWNTTTHTCISL